jgi:hypothetical protein
MAIVLSLECRNEDECYEGELNSGCYVVAFVELESLIYEPKFDITEAPPKAQKSDVLEPDFHGWISSSLFSLAF